VVAVQYLRDIGFVSADRMWICPWLTLIRAYIDIPMYCSSHRTDMNSDNGSELNLGYTRFESLIGELAEGILGYKSFQITDGTLTSRRLYPPVYCPIRWSWL